jgi:ferredoxin
MVPNIDYSLCQGCGGCSDTYPRFFELRDDKAWVINASEFIAAEYDDVLKVCPYYAITLEEA